MEESQPLKGLDAFSKKLAERLEKCRNTTKQLDAEHTILTENIKKHFDECISVLMARKDLLLREAESKLKEQKSNLANLEQQLIKSRESADEIRKTGNLVYGCSKIVAENMWKDAINLPCPEISFSSIQADLPEKIFKLIQTHGKIGKSFGTSESDTLVNVTTLAGSTRGYEDGKGKNAKFNFWRSGLHFNPIDECLYICDTYNHVIRKLNLQGDASTFIEVESPSKIAIFNKENTLFVVSGHAIYKIASGKIKYFAGSTTERGTIDGIGTEARFGYISSITIDQQAGDLYVSTSTQIRKILPTGRVSTIAGGQTGFVDGIGNASKFGYISSIFFDNRAGILLVCDAGNNRLRCVSLQGKVSTLCSIHQPSDVLVISNTILVSSSPCKCIYQVLQYGDIYEAKLIAGSGIKESIDGNGLKCAFTGPYGIAFCTRTQTCFIADYGADSAMIREFSFTK